MDAQEGKLRKRIAQLLRNRGDWTTFSRVLQEAKAGVDDLALRGIVERNVAEHPRMFDETPWQPIGSAPKFDDPDFELLLFYGDLAYPGYWEPDDDSWRSRQGDQIYPSHWAPLTKPKS